VVPKEPQVSQTADRLLGHLVRQTVSQVGLVGLDFEAIVS
jgi:hypothetical protein